MVKEIEELRAEFDARQFADCRLLGRAFDLKSFPPGSCRARGCGANSQQSTCASRLGKLMKTTQTIEYSEAKQIIDLIVERALAMQKAAVIAVADSHGELIAFARMDGAPISSIRIAANKAWTAARERKPTKEIGEKARHPEKGHDIAYYGDPRFVGWGGGIPVWKDGQVAGAVAVSGLSSSEDIVLASLGVELVSGQQT
jgi:glc operon protein GlcG